MSPWFACLVNVFWLMQIWCKACQCVSKETSFPVFYYQLLHIWIPSMYQKQQNSLCCYCYLSAVSIILLMLVLASVHLHSTDFVKISKHFTHFSTSFSQIFHIYLAVLRFFGVLVISILFTFVLCLRLIPFFISGNYLVQNLSWSFGARWLVPMFSLRY